MAEKKKKKKTVIKTKRNIRQELTLKNLEKGMSMSKAMSEAGYKEGYSHNPQELKEKKSWQELMDKYIPRDLVASKHNELMKSVTVKEFNFPDTVSEKDIKAFAKGVSETTTYVKEVVSKVNSKGIPTSSSHRWVVFAVVPNGMDVKAAIDMAIKLRGDYSAEKIEVKRPLGEVPDNELWEQARKRGLFNKEK